ncbi:MAG: 2-oxoglutarate dehydrogenase complex dihydrolipoyllysine-residue succinyltransferase [Alphaproteobacteria bacterium]
MSTEIRVPTLGESVTEATIAQWFKKPGEAVAADEPLVELETDKVTLEVPAPAAGTLSEILANEGDTVEVNALLGTLTAGEGAAPAKPAADPSPAQAPADAPAADARSAPSSAPSHGGGEGGAVMPAARRVIEENQLDAGQISGSGRDGRVTKGDALQALESRAAAPARTQQPATPSGPRAREDVEERVRMTRLRQTIAQRLKQAQDVAAMLTTFNEVDMSHIMEIRNQYKGLFEKRHGVRLGFMSFFVKACVRALQEIPAVNAEIDGTDIVYKHYYDIGVAVGTDRGLVVPVLRDAEKKSFSDIEKEINDFGIKARDGNLSLDDLQGGTFTISNGGVYGSLMSTPILNMPQSGILGMHKIEQRPVVINGEIVVRPMMYLALSYDHRLVDGKEAVTFLVRVKETLEDPQRVILGL